MTREDLLPILSELIRNRIAWNLDKVDDKEWADGLVEEILDTIDDNGGYEL